MSRLRSQQGAGLILIMGVIATLAILAAAMVVLSINVQHNTAKATSQGKAFNVAEAGLDAGQSALWVKWPAPADGLPGGPAPAVLPTVSSSAFQAQFSASEFPSPTGGGNFVTLAFYDDDNNLTNPGVRTQYSYDENANGRMWIESRGATGTRAAKVMALVQKIDYDVQIRQGVALYTDGVMSTNGTGNQPVVGLDPPATTATVYAQGGWSGNGNTEIQGGIDLVQNDPTVALQDVFPDEVLTNLIDTAAAAGKYYTTQADIPTSDWSTDPRIIVIERGGVDAKDMPDTDGSSVWSENHPGILICLSGDMNQTGQQKSIYGIVYLMSGLLLRGNAEIHGMVVTQGSADMRGTRAVNYNATVMANLNRPVTLSVKLVPNTWREIQP